MTYDQALNRQKGMDIDVVKVRRLPDRYRVWTRAGKVHDFRIEDGQKIWPVALIGSAGDT